MRLFIAVNLPQQVRRGMWEAAESLRARSYPIRWVPPDSLHLTLKFLGEVAAEREEEIVGGIRRAVKGTKPFTLPIAGFGAFPSPVRPRVVWVGCEGVPSLELLQHRVEQEMDRLGFPVEGRPFHPHLTLGRVKRGVKQQTLAGFAADLGPLEYAAEVLVESVDLMQSELMRDGARYTRRRKVELEA